MTSNSTISTTIREWNDNFFQPRGIRIITSTGINNFSNIGGGNAAPSVTEPVSYSHTGPQASFPEASNPAKNGRKGMFDGLRSFSSREANSRGFRMGPIVADNDGFRIGKDLVVSQSSIIVLYSFHVIYTFEVTVMLFIVFVLMYILPFVGSHFIVATELFPPYNPTQ
jgi:hypothetical protein